MVYFGSLHTCMQHVLSLPGLSIVQFGQTAKSSSDGVDDKDFAFCAGGAIFVLTSLDPQHQLLEEFDRRYLML
jgi:hypothetical protein